MLKIDNIHSYYGESYIIQGVSIELNEGEILTILGRNGAGKSTILKSIVGLMPPKKGRIYFQGKDITNMKPYEIQRLGISLVPEERCIFSRLTVEENLIIGASNTSDSKIKKKIESVNKLFPILEERKDNRGHQLSGGEQQMLAIGRALMSEPKLLILDEPCEGLAPLVIKEIARNIKKISKRSITILLVEQNIEMTQKIAHRHYIVDQGKIIYVGDNEDFKRNKEIRNKYLCV